MTGCVVIRLTSALSIVHPEETPSVTMTHGVLLICQEQKNVGYGYKFYKSRGSIAEWYPNFEGFNPAPRTVRVQWRWWRYLKQLRGICGTKWQVFWPKQFQRDAFLIGSVEHIKRKSDKSLPGWTTPNSDNRFSNIIINWPDNTIMATTI